MSDTSVEWLHPPVAAQGGAVTRQLLSEVVRKRLSERHLTVSALADDIGVHRPTLVAWLKKNSFPAEYVARLGSALDLGDSSAELSRRYLFEESAWSWAGAGRTRRTQPSHESQGAATAYQSLLSSHGAGATFASAFLDSIPTEWMEGIVRDSASPCTATLKALMEQKGARICYLIPSGASSEAFWERCRLPKGLGAKALMEAWCAANELPRSRITLEESDLPLFLPGVNVVAVGSSEREASAWRAALLIRPNEGRWDHSVSQPAGAAISRLIETAIDQSRRGSS